MDSRLLEGDWERSADKIVSESDWENWSCSGNWVDL